MTDYPPVGARIRVETWGGDYLYGTVEAHGTKDDRPLVDYKPDGGGFKWAYLYQVEVVD